MANASGGGLISSAYPPAKSWQDRLLAVQTGVVSLQAGLASANDKLDRIANTIVPMHGYSGCADLVCAVAQGADAPTIR